MSLYRNRPQSLPNGAYASRVPSVFPLGIQRENRFRKPLLYPLSYGDSRGYGRCTQRVYATAPRAKLYHARRSLGRGR